MDDDAVATTSGTTAATKTEAPKPPEVQQETPGILKTTIWKRAISPADKAKANSDMRDEGNIIVQKARALHYRAYNPYEHFLLADLDYDKDSLLFGSTREEFDQNVDKMKKVIIEFSKWERRDNYYKYATWAVQALVAYLVYDTYEQSRARDLMARSLDNYTEWFDEEMHKIGVKHQADVDTALLELRERPPDFSPVVQAREREEHKRKLAEAEGQEYQPEHPADKKKPDYNPMDTLRQQETAWEEEKARILNLDVTSPSNTTCVRFIRRTFLPQSDDKLAIVKETMADYQHRKYQSLNFPKEPTKRQPPPPRAPTPPPPPPPSDSVNGGKAEPALATA